MRGSFLKVVTILLLCSIEDAAKNGNATRLNTACARVERLLKHNLIISENCSDKMLVTHSQSQMLAINTYIISFLYTLAISGYPTEITATIRQSIRSIMIYLLSLVDFLNARTGGSFNTYESVRKKSSDRISTGASSNSITGENETIFSLTTFDFLRSIISANLSEPIITIPEIRQQKSNQFSNIDSTIFTREWIDAFTDNPIAKGLMQNYFGESVMKINSKIFSSLHQAASKIELARDSLLKKRTSTARLLEDTVYEKVAKIHETEDNRKHEITAFDEEMMRIAKSLWRKTWKRMRIYAGQWRHPAFWDQQDEKFRVLEWDETKDNTIFYHKMSKYETEARARPFLKLKLIEPSYVDEYSKALREKKQHKQLLSVNTDIFPALGVQNLYIPAEKTSPMLVDKEKNKTFSFSKTGKGIFKAFMSDEQHQQSTGRNSDKKRLSEQKIAHDTFGAVRTTVKDEIFLTKRAQWIKTLTSRTGFLQLTTTKLVFIFDGLTQGATNVAFLAFKLQDDKRIFKEWPLENIREIQRRRYITRKSALEVFFIDGFSVLFNFPNGDHEEVVQKLASMKKPSIPNLIYHGTLDPKKILEKTGITKRWQNYEISNFEYLMALNSLAGRSYKDLTQYHVFPWILAQYTLDIINLDSAFSYRDLSSPMGALGPEERRATFQSRYENFDVFSSTPKFHFGSHYSSPAIVLQYLVRLYPYADGAKELQGGRFDLADRLFFSIEESYHAATEEISDVRELVPEFFFLPNFLCNQDRLDYGLTQNGQRVNHVLLPRWSKNDPYLFVTVLRLALESDIVSKNLHSWIDLIFGYKQRGKEAEKALNTFYHLTYEDMVDLDKITDPGLRAATETQIIHFGQTPSQLFVRPHPQRLSKESLFAYKKIADPTADIHLYRPTSKKKVPVISEFNTIFSVYGRSLIKLRFASKDKLIGVRRDGTFTYFRWGSTDNSTAPTTNVPFSCGVDKEKTVQLEKVKNEVCDGLDRSLEVMNYPLVLLDNGKLMVCGGFWDGRMFLLATDNDHILETYYNHTETVSALAVDKDETYLVTGSKCGECFLWKITTELRLSLKFQYYDHEGMVSSAFVSSELIHFASSGHDGRINIYNLHTGNLLRVIFHPQGLPIENVLLTSSPLAAVIFSSVGDRQLYSYSVNGQLLEVIKEESSHCVSPVILKDLNKIECLAYGTLKGELCIRELPYLTLRKKFPASEAPVLSLLVSPDQRFLLCGCGDGEISVLTDPNYSPITSNSLTINTSPGQTGTSSAGRLSSPSIQPKIDTSP